MGKKRARQEKLEQAVALIQRRFGPRALVRGRPSRTVEASGAIPHIPTGFPALDQALGVGGFPKGKIVELTGQGTSGKTTLALKFLAQAQACDQHVGYVDQARYFDPDYAHRCGLDLSRLLIGRPYDLPEALAMTETLVRDGGLAALVFDALDVVWTDSEAARPLVATLDRLTPALTRSGAVLLFLHGLDSGASPALLALAHYAGLRLQPDRERWLHRHGDVRGYQVQVTVRKNRLGPSGRSVRLEIAFNGTVKGNGL